ncbi:MAG TPA: thioesterase family protein [Aquabacterium sp.]|uniref:thioesterase family protein n=1 Tax=Aquabacterium sp. TaxID=1872578 RepID=UPI002E2EC2DA|nr:thioesterase family protein [Aquabacterium sp.]HEX5374518.1 thioesterase family protein [Aquabacterium sp.]
MTSLAQVIQTFSATEGFSTPANWHQGRTIYGGLSAALALEAALQVAPPDLPPLRSAQILFVAPGIDGLNFKAQTLRQGKSATLMGVDGMVGDQLMLRVAFLFAHPRPSSVQHDFTTCPDVNPPARCISLHETGPTPIHLSNFDIRMAGPSLPVTGGDHPELLAWVRHKDAVGVDPAVALLALGDSLPPGVMACFKAFAPISSMTWNLDLAAPAAAGGWYLLRSTSHRARDGYSFQTMDIWDENRQLVLSGNQTVAIFA